MYVQTDGNQFGFKKSGSNLWFYDYLVKILLKNYILKVNFNKNLFLFFYMLIFWLIIY